MTTKPKPKPRVAKAPSRSKTVASKSPVKKASKATTPSTKSSVVKKSSTSKAPSTKKAPVKKTSKVVPPTPPIRELNENGFVEGTDSAIIAASLLEGAATRADVNLLAEQNIAKINGIDNRNGGTKYVPSMVSGIYNRMMATGEYEVESTWKLVRKEKPVRKPRAKK